MYLHFCAEKEPPERARAKNAAFLTLVLVVVCQGSHVVAQEVASTDAGQAAQELHAAMHRAEEALDNAERLNDRSESLLRLAESSEKHVDSVLSIIQSGGLVLGVLAVAFGYAEFKARARNKRLLREARETLVRMEEIETDAKVSARNTAQSVLESSDAAKRVKAMEEGLIQAWAEVDEAAASVPEVNERWIVGSPRPSSGDPSLMALFADSDRLITVCDRLNIIPDGERLAVSLCRLGKWWAFRKDYPRAEARFRRAIEMAPSAERHCQHARALGGWAAESEDSAKGKAELLALARGALEEAERAAGGTFAPAVHYSGWIDDEEGEYEKAVECYKQARELDAEEAAALGRQEHQGITYDLACALTKLGRFRQAIAEFAKLSPLKTYLDAAKTDRDLATLRKTPQWKNFLKSNNAPQARRVEREERREP